jgi:hypothetical protein
VIIRNLRIAKAGVFFPMPETRVVDDSFGSRHRAALGITEETDAVVVIVSEERGTISFCFNGNIASNLDGPKLRTMLEAIFSPKLRKKKRKVAARPTPLVTEAEPASERASKSSAIQTPVSERVPKSLKAAEAESTPLVLRSSRDEETLPLRPRPAAPAEEERDSEPPPPPLRPRVLVEPESSGAAASASRASTPPPPLRTPAVARPVEMPKTPMPVTVRNDEPTDDDDDDGGGDSDDAGERREPS